MIYIRTCAYNAESTLRRTIERVLNQTYSDFVYYVLDNGSKDATGDILRSYAKKDNRIVPYFNKINRNLEENPDFWNITRHIPEGDYFCILDADDWYEPTFLEEMLAFIGTNHLDIAACGTTFFDAASGNVVGGRVIQENCILDDADSYSRFFPYAHWNFRQVWGKLYSSRTAKARYEMELPEWWPSAYGGDTVNVLHCSEYAERIGVYAKSLHNYPEFPTIF